MDFRKSVVDAVDRLIQSEAVEKKIHETVEKSISKVIEDQLGSYSEFGKWVGEAVKSALKVGGHFPDLPSYNDLVVKIVQRQVDAQIGAVLQKQVAENMSKLLETPPETITVSKLVEQFKELAVSRYDECRCHGARITAIIERSKSSIEGISDHWYLGLDENRDRDRHQSLYSCRYQISVNGEGEVYGLTIDRADLDKRLFTGPFYGFERLLFQLKVAGTKLLDDTNGYPDCEINPD